MRRTPSSYSIVHADLGRRLCAPFQRDYLSSMYLHNPKTALLQLAHVSLSFISELSDQQNSKNAHS